jgi:hypothetical protein
MDHPQVHLTLEFPMNLEPDTDTPVHMRLDDIFRLLLHDRTMETLRLLLPDLSLTDRPTPFHMPQYWVFAAFSRWEPPLARLVWPS